MRLRHELAALTLSVCMSLALACGGSVYANSGGAAQPQAVELSRDCFGRCSPSLVPLAGGRALASWTADDRGSWAQLIDLRQHVLLGGPIRLGQLNAGELPLADQPLLVPAPDGDLLMFGVLADGRVTLTRGSESPERRVAPRVVVAADDAPLIGIAASADPAGAALLLLRRPAGFDADIRKPSPRMIVEVHFLTVHGEAVPGSARFTAPSGFSPSVQRSGGHTLAAWRVGDHIVAHWLASDGTQSESKLKLRAGSPVMGSVISHGDELGILLGRKRAFDADSTLPELLLAEVPTRSVSAATWRTFKLPARPAIRLVNDGRLDLQSGWPKTQVLLTHDGGKEVATIDLATGALARSAASPHGAESCIALDGSGILCATARPVRTTDECPARQTRIELASSASDLRTAPRREFWATGEIAEVDRSAASEVKNRFERLSCSEPAFTALRAALLAWCESGREAAYCAAEDPGSLLFQAAHCRDYPVSCPPARRRRQLSVNRRDFERGARVELSSLDCTVGLAHGDHGWVVADNECTGD